MGRIVEGVFNVAGDAITIVSAPDITREQLRRFASLLAATYGRDITLDDMERAAEAINPRLGDAVRQIRKSGPGAASVLLLVLLAMHSCSFNMDVKLDINRLVDQVFAQPPAAIIEQMDEHSSSADDAKEQHTGDGANAARETPTQKHQA